MKQEYSLFRAFAVVCLLAASSWAASIPVLQAARPSVGTATLNGERLTAAGESLLQDSIDRAELPAMLCPDFGGQQNDVREFYAAFPGRLPWFHGGEPTSQAPSVIAVLQNAGDEGLNPADYDGPRWSARLAALDQRGQSSEADRIQFDLALTISVMRYVSDLHRGRVNPRLFHFDLDIGNQKFDLAGFVREKLVSATDVNAAMRTAEPPFPAYRRTVAALNLYTKLAHEDDGEILPASRKPVKPGELYAGVPRLVRLLHLVGDLPEQEGAPADPIYEGDLVNAVKRFQARQGLEPNGIIDPSTLKELNIPLAQRAEQIEVTLERWRWLPHEFAQPPIVVNIPEFRVRAFDDEYRSVLSMEVVVGRAYGHQTPVFATQMTAVTFRPYWNVPLSIQRKELLPEIRKNPSYLLEHSYEVVDRKGNVISEGAVSEELVRQLRTGALAIRQLPGSENALGLIKFEMPNAYDVYMHGTPAVQLFSRSRRDFSHGCIRVQDPVALAAWVLRDKPEWDVEHIQAAMNGETTFRVNPDKPIPVLILYGTAIVTDEGEVHFYRDIYGLDAALEQVLAKGYPYGD